MDVGVIPVDFWSTTVAFIASLGWGWIMADLARSLRWWI